MTLTSARRARPPVWSQVVGALAVAALSAGAWFGWLGWDSTYQVDPVTQVVGLTVATTVVSFGVLGLRRLSTGRRRS